MAQVSGARVTQVLGRARRVATQRGKGGFAYIGPTVRPSKVTGEEVTYRWTSLPDFAAIGQPDASGAAFSALVRPAQSQQRGGSSSPGQSIPEGQRNAELARLAGSMRRPGMSQASIEAALIVVNPERCTATPADEEVRRIAAAVARYAPAAEPDSGTTSSGAAGGLEFPHTDAGNGELIAHLYRGQLCYDIVEGDGLCTADTGGCQTTSARWCSWPRTPRIGGSPEQRTSTTPTGARKPPAGRSPPGAGRQSTPRWRWPVLVRRRNETISAEVAREFERLQSQDEWRQRSLAELFGPIVIQLERTRRALRRWNKHSPYLEARIVKTGNEKVLEILLTRGDLIPADLMSDAAEFIEHCDAWLEEFDRWRAQKEAGADDPTFIFMGPSGHPFPREAERRFRERLDSLRRELWGSAALQKAAVDDPR